MMRLKFPPLYIQENSLKNSSSRSVKFAENNNSCSNFPSLAAMHGDTRRLFGNHLIGDDTWIFGAHAHSRGESAAKFL